MSRDSISNNIAVGSIGEVASSTSGTVDQVKSTLVTDSKKGTASISNAARSKAAGDANSSLATAKNKPILPSSVQQEGISDGSPGASLLDSATAGAVPRVDANSLIYNHCAMNPSAVQGQNNRGDGNGGNCECGCCDCKDDSFFSCSSFAKVGVGGGGFILGSILTGIVNGATSLVLGLGKAVADGLMSVAHALRSVFCTIAVALDADNPGPVLAASGIFGGDKVDFKAVKMAATKGNVTFLKDVKGVTTPEQQRSVLNSNSRAVGGNVISNGRKDQLGALNEVNPEWSGDMEPGDVDSVANTRGMSDEQERDVLMTSDIENAGDVSG